MRLRPKTPSRRAIRPERAVQRSLPALPASAPATPTRRRRRAPLLIAVLLALLTAAVAALVLTLPHLSVADAHRITNDATPLVAVRVTHPRGVRAARVDARVDGTRIATEDVRVLDGGRRIELQLPSQADGTHQIDVRLYHVGLLRTTTEQQWTLTVDTKAPAQRIVSPLPNASEDDPYVPKNVVNVTRLPFAVVVGAEAGATVEVTSDAAGAPTVREGEGRGTRRSIEVTLPQGLQTLRVTATDAAGNETVRTRRVLVDTTGPTVTLRPPRVVTDAHLALPIGARDPHGVSLEVRLDGVTLDESLTLTRTDSTPPPNQPSDSETSGGYTDPTPANDLDGDQSNSEDAASDGATPVAARWTIDLETGAYEGRHVLQVAATDELGRRTLLRRAFFVDSTEQLATATGLQPGARGMDVLQLHNVLVRKGVVTRAALATDARSRTYGAQTRAAVRRFQSKHSIEADGIAGGDTLAVLTLKIVVDRRSHRITLYRMDRVVKSWGVAVGSPAYPTPAGDFSIEYMEKNPTWTPPDSDWAKDAKVIPPGANNPLGTRWMRIFGTVGIHGTNSPSSIGFSVSHGCIRMAIPDVEELYEMVRVGTPVSVV